MKTGNVLVVDDEKSQRDIVKTILQSADYDVETAANGQQAGELYRTGNFDVVLTDLDALRDSNFLYSSLWRLGIKWWSSDGRYSSVTSFKLAIQFSPNVRTLAESTMFAGLRKAGMPEE